MRRAPSSSHRDAKSSQREQTHITPIVAAQRIVVFRVALTVADQEPITGARGELRHHLRVKAGRVPAINAAAAAHVLWGTDASAQTTLEEGEDKRVGGKDEMERVIGRCHP